VKGLAIEAGKKALEMAQVEPEEVDLVVLCTSTPDDLFGSGSQVITPDHILSCL
jgi:3-oxoacyl-[acyl-carrier-protein] synthase III